MPGFQALRLLRGIERPNRYLLLVEWATLEDHTARVSGLGRVPGMEATAAITYYDPFPTVEHFAPVFSSCGRTAGSAERGNGL